MAYPADQQSKTLTYSVNYHIRQIKAYTSETLEQENVAILLEKWPKRLIDSALLWYIVKKVLKIASLGE